MDETKTNNIKTNKPPSFKTGCLVGWLLLLKASDCLQLL